MPNMEFQPAEPKHAPLIADFQLRMAWETEGLRLDPAVCAEGVKAVFERPHLGSYHIAKQGERVVAALLLTTEWSDWRNGTVWWIHSVFVEPELRGQGLFGRFYAYVRGLAEATPGVRGLRLYVDRTNERAQAVYGKLGMNGDHYRLFEWMKTF